MSEANLEIDEDLVHVFKSRRQIVKMRAGAVINNFENEIRERYYFSDGGFDPKSCSENQPSVICTSPPQTIFDPPHIDAASDFHGLAISVEGQEVVLKSQLIAGWYRYASEWRFHVDGTLKPRWGFSAVKSGSNCVCQVHRHHFYWRLDFDIVNPENVVREFNDPPLSGTSHFHDILFESKRQKNPGRKRHWEISNRRKGNTYGLFPGPNDGTSDAFGVGALWVLKFHPGELDDGRVSGEDQAKIDEKFATLGEFVKDSDVVIWYAAHFRHDQIRQGGAGQIVGPDLRPLKW